MFSGTMGQMWFAFDTELDGEMCVLVNVKLTETTLFFYLIFLVCCGDAKHSGVIEL